MKKLIVISGLAMLVFLGAGCASPSTPSRDGGLFSGSSQGEVLSNSGNKLPVQQKQPVQLGPQ